MQKYEDWLDEQEYNERKKHNNKAIDKKDGKRKIFYIVWCSSCNKMNTIFRKKSDFECEKCGFLNIYKTPISKIRDNLLTEYKKCQLCGNDNDGCLDCHHIIPRCQGGKDDKKNLIMVCPNCHAKIHRGFIKL
jgi:predicted RNA-binding Zn-ribbon protein involved in translation (DUF1610 family)